MMPSHLKRAALSRGMTLIEVVIALALLAVVGVILTASLRGFAGTAERQDTQAQRLDEWRVSTALLSTLLGRTSAKPVPNATAPRFVGQADQMVWLGLMPARHGPSGLHFFKLSLQPSPVATSGLSTPGQALVLQYLPLMDQPGEPAAMPKDWPEKNARVLLEGVTALTLAYDGQGMNDGWLDAWPTDQKRLPERVRLSMQMGERALPPVVLPILELPITSQRAGGGFVIGGS